MGRQDRGLGTPFTADGPTLAAILGALDDIHDLLDERLPRPDKADQSPAEAPADPEPEPAPEPIEITEPDPTPGPEPIDIKEPAPPKRQPRRTAKKG